MRSKKRNPGVAATAANAPRWLRTPPSLVSNETLLHAGECRRHGHEANQHRRKNTKEREGVPSDPKGAITKLTKPWAIPKPSPTTR